MDPATEEMKDAIIRLKDVCYKYEDGTSDAVDHINLDVERGEMLAVLGRNGCGKSTMARLLNALMLPTSGEVWVDGIQVSEKSAFDVRSRCGMVFQNPDNQIVATVVEEDCAFGLENQGVKPEEIRIRVDRALEAVGMRDRALSSPSMLSGGQKQRVAIAGVLAMQPKIIIFDESTAMLDPIGRRDVFSIARRLNREEGVTVLWITHFMEEAVQADRVVVMDKGRIAMTGTPREVFTHVDEIAGMGLDVPEAMLVARELRDQGLPVRPDILTMDEMAVELCRLKSAI